MVRIKYKPIAAQCIKFLVYAIYFIYVQLPGFAYQTVNFLVSTDLSESHFRKGNCSNQNYQENQLFGIHPTNPILRH